MSDHTAETKTTTGMGAAYGTAKSGIGIANVGVFRPDLIMKVGYEDHTNQHAMADLHTYGYGSL